MSRREKARKEYEDAKQARLDVRARRADAARQQEQLAAEREQVMRETEVERVLPGSDDAAVAVATSRATEIEQALAELEEAEGRADARLEVATAELRAATEAEVPGALEDLAKATEPVRRALASLGRRALDEYAKAVGPLEKRREALSTVEGLVSELKGDPRVVGEQRRRVRSWVRDTLTDATPDERAGFLVWAFLTWARKGGTSIEEAWSERKVPTRGGSVLLDPFALGDAIHLLRSGRLPL